MFACLLTLSVCVFACACSARMGGRVAVHVCVFVSSVCVCVCVRVCARGLCCVVFASFGRTCDVYRGCALLDLFDRLKKGFAYSCPLKQHVKSPTTRPSSPRADPMLILRCSPSRASHFAWKPSKQARAHWARLALRDYASTMNKQCPAQRSNASSTRHTVTTHSGS